MFITRIANRKLSVLCERVGVAFDVGQDPFRIFEREAGNGRSQYGKHMKAIAARVERGGSLAEAIHAQGNYFPPNFVHLIEVGETTGRLETVLDRMATYYKDLADLRDDFFSSITWPLIQLVLGIVVVGGIIYVPSLFATGDPNEADFLGIGLVGTQGLLIYLAWVAGFAVLILFLYLLIRNGILGFLGDLFTRVPILGRTLLIFDEATFVQTLSLSIEAGMDAWTSIGLAFKSASSWRFRSKAESAKEAIQQGRDMHSVLQETGLFSAETIEAVQLGEEAGRLAETLDKHFRYLRMKVKFAMSTLTNIASTIIWVIIAAVIITVIFRVFSRYLGGIEEAGTAIIERGTSVQPPVPGKK